jgi:hypothetical protein
MSNAASEAGYMSAPDYTQYLFQKILLAPIGASIHAAMIEVAEKTNLAMHPNVLHSVETELRKLMKRKNL